MIPAGESLDREFLSTPSARRATLVKVVYSEGANNFYPRPPRGGRRTSGGLGIGIQNDFYPRPPRGGRQKNLRKKSKSSSFLSTPSARRATSDVLELKTAQLFLSTPSARRATRSHNGLYIIRKYFYPRPPRGGRRRGDSPAVEHQKFLSTPSARRATDVSSVLWYSCTDFYPRPPRGGRPSSPADTGRQIDFYPRPPRGGRRLSFVFVPSAIVISIHALREEGDFA